MSIHGNLDQTNGIHFPASYVYADASARNAATGFVAADVGKFARQTDTGAYYQLGAVTPTWYPVSPAAITGDVSITTAGVATVTDLTIASEARGDVLYRGASAWLRLAAGTSGYYLKTQGAGADPVWAAVSATKPNYKASFPAGSAKIPSTNGAEFNTDTFTNGTIDRWLFDKATPEAVEALIVIPSDVSGTVTFRVCGYAETVGIDKDVVFDLWHSAKADSEGLDAAYTNKSSGALRCDNTQDDLDIFEWTETMTNLGWAAGDHIRIKLERDADNGSDNLDADYGVTVFEIEIPRA